MRLDVALVERFLVPSRNKAQQYIPQGIVFVNGIAVTKRSYEVQDTDVIEVRSQNTQYVSRGAYKLLGALDAFTPMGFPNIAGKYCLDIGASTGGFTQVLLERGAAKVIALDVGHDQLAAVLKADARVVELSGMNIRSTTREDVPFAAQIVVSDVSFISLTYVIPHIADLVSDDAHALLLIKPQFEVGRAALDKHGIVTHEADRKRAVDTVCTCARQNGWVVEQIIDSPITGTHGNAEFLLWLRRSENN